MATGEAATRRASGTDEKDEQGRGGLLTAVYTTRINLDDYPVYTYDGHEGAARTEVVASDARPAVLDYPGLHLAEHHALQGVRYAGGLGYVAAVLYFYGYHRPRLPFADRPLAKLHHFFYPSVGYTTPVGLLCGLVHGARADAQRIEPAFVARTKEENRRAAQAAHAQYEQRRARAEHRLRSTRPWYATLAMAWGLVADPTEDQLRRMNFVSDDAGGRPGGMGRRTWESFVAPDSMLGVALRSRIVRDSRFYKGDLPTCCQLLPYRTAQGEGAAPGKPGGGKRSKAASVPPPPVPPQTARLTKDQVDGLVSNVLTLRHNSEEARWTRTGARFSLYGMFAMLIAWNQGNALFRLSMGLGAGTVAGAVISAMKLDDIWSHM